MLLDSSIGIIRVLCWAGSFIYTVRFLMGAVNQQGSFLRGLLKQVWNYPQDLVLIFWMPLFAYLVFVQTSPFARMLEQLVCLPLTMYIFVVLFRGVHRQKH